MAHYNEIQTGRHNRFIQKLFGMKGEVPAPQLSSEISVAHPLFHGAENRYLESWNRFGFGVSVAAVAAINSALRIRNPATSNVIAVLEKASIGSSVAGAFVLGMVQTAADLVVIATGINNRLDLRQGSQGSAMIISNTDATHPASGITTLNGNSPANQQLEFIWYENQELSILPGQAVDLISSAQNQAVVVMYQWRERFLEEPERQ